jgi:hypothetical protein
MVVAMGQSREKEGLGKGWSMGTLSHR